MLPILIQGNILSKIIQILEGARTITNTSISSFYVSWTNESTRIRNYQFLVVPSPYIFRKISFYRIAGKLRIQKQESSSTILKLFDQFFFSPELHIVNEENNMNSSFAGLNQFKQSGVCSRRGIYGIGGDPKVLLSSVDHFPHSSEKLISLYYKLSLRESDDLPQRPRFDLFSHRSMRLVKSIFEQLVNIHEYSLSLNI